MEISFLSASSVIQIFIPIISNSKCHRKTPVIFIHKEINIGTTVTTETIGPIQYTYTYVTFHP